MSEDLVFALEKLADESRPVRLVNLAALSDVPRAKAELFREAWAHFSPERRLELVQELVEQAEANIHLNFYAILRELLYDVDGRVRKLAIEGLWEDNRPNLIPPLVRMLAGDPVAEVRAAAAISLGRFAMLGALGEINEGHAEQAEAALREAWSRPRELTDVRRRALESLAYSEGSDVREMIRLAYYDEDDRLRQSAVYAMGRSADRRWSKYVLAELQSQDVAMRFEAAVAAGELALAAAVEPLIQLLDDPDASVRDAAASALGEIGGPNAKRALEAAARSRDEDLADAAETALEQISFNSGSGMSDALFEFPGPSGATMVPENGNRNRDDEDDESPSNVRFEDRFYEDEKLDDEAAFEDEELDEELDDERLAGEDEDEFVYDEDDLDYLEDEDDDELSEEDDQGDEDW